jgi:hypothetical protein
MLKPLVKSSNVTGLTPVMKQREIARLEFIFIVLKNLRK